MPLTPPPTGAPRRSVGQARRLLLWRLGVRPTLRRSPVHSLGLHGIPSGYAIGSCPRPPAGGTPFAVPAKGVGWRGPLAPLGTLGMHHRRVPSTARRRHTLWGPCQRCGLAGPPVPAPQSRPCGRRLRSLHVGRRVPRAGVWSVAARGGWPNFGSLPPRGPELSSWGRHGEAPDIRVIHSPRRHLPHSTGQQPSPFQYVSTCHWPRR